MAKDQNQPFNWDEEVGTREDAKRPEKLHWVVGHDWITYSGSDATEASRNLFGGRFLYWAFFPRKEEGKVYGVPLNEKRKGAEEVKESRSRKTMRFNILAGLAEFKLEHHKGKNMQFTVTPEENTRYGKAMVLDVNSLEPTTQKTREPVQKKAQPGAEQQQVQQQHQQPAQQPAQQQHQEQHEKSASTEQPKE